MEAYAIRRGKLFGRMNPRRGSLLTVALIAATLIAGCGTGEGPEGLKGMTRTPPTEVGDLRLPNENPHTANRITALQADGNGLMLVYFGYTSCPDVCPTTLADVRLAVGELSPEQRRRVQVGMVTVDPERDTGKVLNGYLGHFFDRDGFASFVPGTNRELARAEKAFGASHKLGKPDEKGSYDVDHTAQVFAVDSKGTVKVEWAFGTPADDIAADLKKLLESESSREDA